MVFSQQVSLVSPNNMGLSLGLALFFHDFDTFVEEHRSVVLDNAS